MRKVKVHNDYEEEEYQKAPITVPTTAWLNVVSSATSRRSSSVCCESIVKMSGANVFKVFGRYTGFVNRSLTRLCSERSSNDIATITSFLSHLHPCFYGLSKHALRLLAASALLERLEAGTYLFRHGDPIRTWFILLYGSVMIDDGNMKRTIVVNSEKSVSSAGGSCCFGKKTSFDDSCVELRKSSCVALEYSEILVLEQIDNFLMDDCNWLAKTHDTLTLLSNDTAGCEREKRECSNVSEDGGSLLTSTASLSSETMVNSGCGEQMSPAPPPPPPQSLSSSPVWYSLQKDARNRTDEDISLITQLMTGYRVFNDNSLSGLLRNRQVARVIVLALVEKSNTIIMHDGEEYDAWTVVINGKIKNVKEISNNIEITIMSVNDCFGIGCGTRSKRHQGTMTTLTDNCQFLCVPKDEYVRLMQTGEHQLKNKIRSLSAAANNNDYQPLPPRCLAPPAPIRHSARRSEEINKQYRPISPNVTSVSKYLGREQQNIKRENFSLKRFEIVSAILLSSAKMKTTTAEEKEIGKGTRSQLLTHLVKASLHFNFSYVGQYILMHRAFNQCSLHVSSYLIEKFLQKEDLREAIVNIFLHWIVKYSFDFENSRALSSKIEQFIDTVHQCKMYPSLRLLAIACTTSQSSLKSVIVERSNRDDPLCFDIIDNVGDEGAIATSAFIFNVEKGSKAEKSGLKRGQEIIEVNGLTLTQIGSDEKSILEAMRQATHLSITVKCNLVGFYDTLLHSSEAKNNSAVPARIQSSSVEDALIETKTIRVGLPKKRFGAIINKQSQQKSHSPPLSSPKTFWRWRRNQMTTANTSTPSHHKNEEFEFVIRIFTSESNFKYLKIDRLTTAHQAASAVLLSSSSHQPATTGTNEKSHRRGSHLSTGSGTAATHLVALYELTHVGNVWKQKRLSDSAQNLAQRLPYGSRYYVKSTSFVVSADRNAKKRSKTTNVSTGIHATMAQLFSTASPDISLETSTDNRFLALNVYELASQMTLKAYLLFSSIKPQEFVNHVFHLSNRSTITTTDIETELLSCPNLDAFANSVNREMYWVVTEIVNETNLSKRALVIKKFIKLARLCKEMKNFNSLLNIVSGLGHKSVCRLQRTWNRVPEKAKKVFAELQALLDPSRNMLKYRSLFRSSEVCPPIIPMLPICIKDLVYIHQANPCKISGEKEETVNFEKFRMISKEIELIERMKTCGVVDVKKLLDMPLPFWIVFDAFNCSGQSRQLADRMLLTASASGSLASSFVSSYSSMMDTSMSSSTATTTTTSSSSAAAAIAANTTSSSFGNDAGGSSGGTSRSVDGFSRSNGSISQSWLKKRYEQIERVRETKAYLDTVHVICDEQELLEKAAKLSDGSDVSATVKLLNMNKKRESPPFVQINKSTTMPSQRSFTKDSNVALLSRQSSYTGAQQFYEQKREAVTTQSSAYQERQSSSEGSVVDSGCTSLTSSTDTTPHSNSSRQSLMAANIDNSSNTSPPSSLSLRRQSTIPIRSSSIDIPQSSSAQQKTSLSERFSRVHVDSERYVTSNTIYSSPFQHHQNVNNFDKDKCSKEKDFIGTRRTFGPSTQL